MPILGNVGVIPHQLRRHRLDPVHEVLRRRLALCHLVQPLLPIRCELGRGQQLRQHRDQVDACLCGDQVLALALHKPAGYQLFNDGRPGRRGAQAAPFRVLRDVLLTRVLHSRQKGVLRVGLGGRSEVLGDGDGDRLKDLPLGQGGKNTLGIFILRLLLQGGTEHLLDGPPALGKHLLSFCREGMPAAVKGGRDRLIHERLRHCTQQLVTDQQKDIALAHRQRRNIRLFQLQGGNQGVVVRYLLVVHQRQNIGEKLRAGVEGRHPRRQMQDHGGGLRHVAGQIPAVRPGIGQQLLFIERLGVIQGLLGRVAEHPVCLPLQGGQVVQFGRFLHLFLPYQRYTHGPLPVTDIPNGLGILHSWDFFRNRLGSLQRQPHMMVFLLAEQNNLAVTVGQHRQGGRLHPPHIQSAVVKDGEQAACVDPNKPVRLLAAKCRLIQWIIVPTGAQGGKALPDRRVLHRRNPEAGERLGTSGGLIDQPEDQLTLAPRVAGVDQLRYIGTLHQGTKNAELGGLFLGHHIAEGGG